MEAQKPPTPANLVSLYNSTKEAKVQLERLRMENLWIEKFLNDNSATPARVQEPADSAVVDVKKKLEFCEQTIYKFEKKINKEQEQNVEQMKDL